MAAFPSHSTAQTSVWNTPEKASSGAKKTLSKTAGTVKRWKNHLEKWGLDTTYNHAVGLTGRLNTNGWTVGLFYQKPKGSIRDRRRGKNAGKSDIWSLTFSEVTHEKQAKQHKENTSFPELGESEPFVFGKINNLYLLQLGYSREQLLLPGVLDGNISVSFRYGGGFSLAMLKPYYLKLMYVEYTPDQIVTLNEERYSPETKNLFLDRDKIFGGSKWNSGLDKIHYIPGAFVDASLVLQPSKNKSSIQTVTLGAYFSVYPEQLPIMAESKAFPYVGYLYVGLNLGKRWN